MLTKPRRYRPRVLSCHLLETLELFCDVAARLLVAVVADNATVLRPTHLLLSHDKIYHETRRRTFGYCNCTTKLVVGTRPARHAPTSIRLRNETDSNTTSQSIPCSRSRRRWRHKYRFNVASLSCSTTVRSLTVICVAWDGYLLRETRRGGEEDLC